ncbi:hypothetical protein A6R68_03074, partial [Neotoma lepida]
ITNALDLKEHLQKTIKKLPAGIKRKLCFALSMLGNPQVTLLDEPSTGMDPRAKQHICIGTVQHLKSKFGKGYFLEIKLKDWIENLEIDRLQREIQYIFPNASRQE